jgi:hypothetical protein
MTGSLIPDQPDLGALIKARESRLVEAQQFIEHGWPDATAQENATLFARVQDWIENGGQRPWEDPPSSGGPYPPLGEGRKVNPL